MTSPVPWQDARSKISGLGLDADAIQWPNEPFTRPVQGEPPADPELWMSVEMTGESSRPIELGTRAGWVETGWLAVHIYTPAGYGTDAARELAQQITDAFRGLEGGEVTYPRMRIGDGQAEDTDGAYWRLSLEIDYRYTNNVA